MKDSSNTENITMKVYSENKSEEYDSEKITKELIEQNDDVKTVYGQNDNTDTNTDTNKDTDIQDVQTIDQTDPNLLFENDKAQGNQELCIKSGDAKVIMTPGNDVPKKTRKRSCRRRKRPTKKMRLILKQISDGAKSPSLDMDIKNIDSLEATVSEDVEYCLTVTNLPTSWSFMDIKNFIDMQCGPVDEIEMIKDDEGSNGGIRLTYIAEDECKQAMMKLSDKDVEGTKLSVSMTVVDLSDSESPADLTPESPKSEEAAIISHWKPDMDSWEIDPKGTYGLRESFLKSLNITPPLDRWVYVVNFRCDKQELREILEMAGKVLQCSVFMNKPKYANVMYSHPLEAVQAISMLSGQTFYDQKLKLVMLRNASNAVVLPKGLSGVGPGLGARGKPIRTITEHYNRFKTNQPCALNTDAFEIGPAPTKVDGNEQFTVQNVENLKYDGETYKIKAKNLAEMKTLFTKGLVLTNDLKLDVYRASNQSTETNFGSGFIAQLENTNTPNTNPNELKQKLENDKQKEQRQTPLPKKSPIRQPAPRNVGSNFVQPGPRPVTWSGLDSRMRHLGPGSGPGWNGPRQMGPIQGPRPMGPRPMGPMHGPGQMGPMQGPGPMGPMQGPGQMGHMQGPGRMGPMHVPRPMGPIQGPGPMGPMQGSGPIGPIQGPGPMGAMHGPGPMGPMGGPMHGPMQGPMQVMGPIQSPMAPGFANPNEPVQLLLSNLPPSTTFAILCEKLASCGQVVSMQLTTPGCAVVTFANRMQADRCFQTYHNYCIEGQTIQVKYT